jgi:hypothetical protein
MALRSLTLWIGRGENELGSDKSTQRDTYGGSGVRDTAERGLTLKRRRESLPVGGRDTQEMHSPAFEGWEAP